MAATYGPWPFVHPGPIAIRVVCCGNSGRVGRAGPTNVADIARAFGLRGIRVEQPGAIGAALREALATDETGVVDVATDIESRAPEPWLPEGGT